MIINEEKMMITCTVVLVTAAVILGFVLKNQVRENPDKNTVNVAIGQWDTTQNESQNYWNPDNHAVAKGMGGYYFIQTTDGISKIAFLMKQHRKRLQSVQNRNVRIVTIPAMRIFVI